MTLPRADLRSVGIRIVPVQSLLGVRIQVWLPWLLQLLEQLHGQRIATC